MLTPTAKPWIIRSLTASFAAVVEPYGILANPRRLCHFLAQAAHESAGFRTLEEFGGATYWSRYEGRADLGNTNSGDGVRYHGRGIFQLTGRANYRSMGGKISVGLEDEPHLAAEGDVSLRTACEYWKSRRLEVPADSNDIREVTRRINGGFNGLADRQTYFRRAWSILGRSRSAGWYSRCPWSLVLGALSVLGAWSGLDAGSDGVVRSWSSSLVVLRTKDPGRRTDRGHRTDYEPRAKD